MDYDWKFLNLISYIPPECPAGTFPINMNNVQCLGLSQATASNAVECAAQCCSEPSCQTYQWCGGQNCGNPNTCWIGQMNDCQSNKPGWVSQGRNVSVPVNTTCNVDYCMPNYDDSAWRTLTVPHDFVVEGKFNQTAEQSHGYLPKGIGWYRKHFNFPASYKGQSIWIYFEGIYRDSSVYLNGKFVGNHPSGYTSFYYDLAPYLNYGGMNVLAIEVDARSDEGWWYEGGGIYRHVWLTVADNLYIPPWGVYIQSVVTGTITPHTNYIEATSADVTIETQVVNAYTSDKTFSITSVIYDAQNQKVGEATTSTTLKAGTNGTTTQTITLGNPVNLWHVNAPYLYRVDSSLNTNVDVVNTTFGVRKFVFDKDQGFILNNIPVKIKGLCNHQDFAGVGIALPKRINEFRVTKLQEMGANGWRMSHNPPNPELLDLTDQLGMLVWDENRNFGDTPQYREDVAKLPLRDRNHPSIVLWSLCNEGGCQEGANDQGALATAQLLKGIIQEYDKTRPVSAAWNSDLNDLLNGWGPKVLDVQGVNYNYGEYDPYHAQYVNKPMIASETASCTGARGIYVTNDTAAHKSIFTAHGCAQEWWTADATRQFIAGGFAWTGFDYKGEPTPYAWPEINSNFGIIDIAGFPKDTFWYYQSWWTNNPVLHVFPHWNQPASSNGLAVVNCNANDKYQQIKYTGSSTQSGQLVTSDGRCIDATCSDVNAGCEPLMIKSCDSNNKNQQFIYKSDHSFNNVGNGGCIDLWDSGTGPGVGVYQCDGGSNQHWDITGSDIKSESTGDRCMTYGPSSQIWVYTNAASAELFVNGVSQGKQNVPKLDHVQWTPTYSPGSIEVKAYSSDGTMIGSQTIDTTGAPSKIALDVEVGGDGIDADGQDAALIKVSVVDSAGRVVPTASNLINFSVSGQGSILGVGNGDPSSHEPDKANYRSAFNGLARVIVQSTQTPGSITLTASSSGLTSAQITVKTVTPAITYPTL
jgi:hypothetical protein